jgi:hypothetical protein
MAFKAQPGGGEKKREEIHAINFDCRTKSHVHAVAEGESLGFRDEGKLLHHVIISYMTRCLTLNRKFTGCMMILDNAPGSVYAPGGLLES